MVTPITRSVSKAAKDLVWRKTKGKCWLCKVNGRYVAHLLDSADPELLGLYVKNDLVKTTNINSHENLIFLCGTCHDSFDLRIPAWVFLPCPLESFLTAEQDFQAARRDNPLAKRKQIVRGGVVFQPYLIREGCINFEDGIGGARPWHGNPILAILRSHGMMQGLHRVAVEKGGVPREVTEMYTTLIALYATAPPESPGPSRTTIACVEIPVNTMGPPPTVGRPGKRRAETEGPSDGESVTVSATPARSDGSTAGGKALWGLFTPPLRRSNRLAEHDNITEVESEAPSEQTGRSYDTQLTGAVPKARPAKRARLDEEGSLFDGAANWVKSSPDKRMLGKGK